jgi:hypothetical protein
VGGFEDAITVALATVGLWVIGDAIELRRPGSRVHRHRWLTVDHRLRGWPRASRRRVRQQAGAEASPYVLRAGITLLVGGVAGAILPMAETPLVTTIYGSAALATAFGWRAWWQLDRVARDAEAAGPAAWSDEPHGDPTRRR